MKAPLSISSQFRSGLALALAAVAAAVVAVSLSACGGSGSNQQELTQARREVAFHIHREERLRKLERELGQVRGGGGRKHTDLRVEVAGAAAPVQGGYVPSYDAAPSYTGSPTSGSCGGELSVNSRTSCPFAANVKQAYFAAVGSGSGSIEAYSPVTHRSYLMSCSGSPHECTGGDDAAVYFP